MTSPFDADLPDQIELAIEEIHMLFFAFEDLQQQVAGYEIPHALATGDALATVAQRPGGASAEPGKSHRGCKCELSATPHA